MVFSSSSDGTGIVEQVRAMMRVDASQWPTSRIVNSCNNYLDTIAGYAIGADRRFQWDDTNHAKFPIGKTDVLAGVSDYAFLTDEQNNKILNITRLEIKHPSSGVINILKPIDQADIAEGIYPLATSTVGFPEYYDKTADNFIRLYPTPSENITDPGLIFYFQRVGSYFVATDTTKEPGVSPLLHRGFVIASAYDGALTLGLNNLSALAVELQKEDLKMKEYFAIRNTDEPKSIRPVMTCAR